MKTKAYYKLPPQFTDGVSSILTDDPKVVIAGLENWMAENKDGDGESVTIEIRQMTEKQFKALPEL